jgi:hypothetical protein
MPRACDVLKFKGVITLSVCEARNNRKAFGQ